MFNNKYGKIWIWKNVINIIVKIRILEMYKEHFINYIIKITKHVTNDFNIKYLQSTL